MTTNTQHYGDDAISSLKDEQQVRERPSVIFGTNDEYGAAHSVYEIIANSIDEIREGYGSQLRMTVMKDGTVTVSDDGRGVPMGYNEAEGKYNWDLVFNTLYASGKYDDSSYGSSLGLNGLGAAATQYASEFMTVESTRDGKTSIMKFEKGKPVGQLKVVDAEGKKTGTTITFKPDSDVFINIKNNALPPQHYVDILRRQAMLHEGMEVILYHEEIGEEITLKYENGMAGFIDSVIDKPILEKTLTFTGQDEGTDDPDANPEPYKVDMRLALNFSRNKDLVELYHNGSHLYDGGVTSNALRLGITRAFEERARELKKLKRSENLSYRDVYENIFAVGDTNAPGNRTFFKHQTKSAINNPFIRTAYREFVYHNTKAWLENDSSTDTIVDIVVNNKKAREEADKVSRRVVQSLKKDVRRLGNKPKKFVDCRTKKKEERELFIVEGDSALGSCKLARDAAFQAIMPVRGKIMNCLKENLTRILTSDIIVDLIRVLGCGIEAKSKYIDNLPKFNIDKLNWGKIIICTDADLDGMQIRCLIITMIYRLMPTLLKEGKVYIAETPLYELSYKGDTVFAYNQAEKDAMEKKLKEHGIDISKVTVQRSKGLGENDPEMMSKSTMAPATRRLIPVEYPEDGAGVAELFESLLGNNIEDRRELINEYFERTEVDID